MAKVSAIVKNNKRKEKGIKFAQKREKLKAIANDISLSPEERAKAMIKLSELPRNSSKVRFKNRCALTGRPRSYYRLFGISRIELRRLASLGRILGLTKSSW
jgi:small subunit ribosomal protein S14